MSLSDVALRSAALWGHQWFGRGFLNDFAATQRLPFGRAPAAVVTFKGCIILGCFGSVFARSVFLSSFWLSFLVLQYVQNVPYKAQDVRPQLIRWFDGESEADVDLAD